MPWPALPPGGDVHLHLPPGMTADDLAQILRTRARALRGADYGGRGDDW